MTVAAADQPAEPETTPRKISRRRQVIQIVLSVALIGAVFVGVLPQVADFGEVFNEIGEMTWLELASLVAIAIWNLATYWFVWVICLPGLGYRQAALVTEASTAVANTVPAGSAVAIGLSYTMFASWGFKRSAITLALLVSGIWNNFAKLALPVLALALLALQGDATGARLVSGVLGIVALAAAVLVFALVLRSEEVARRVGVRAQRAAAPFFRLIRRPEPHGWDEAVGRFRNRTVSLLGRKWAALTLATLVSHLSLYLVLLVTLRHVGVSEAEVSAIEVLAAFAFTRLVSAIPITPGGVGVIELAMTAALVTAGGDREQVVAAVLVYRGLTYLLPIPIGALCYLFWRSRSLPSLS